jgi:methionyl aminopeptidase
MTIIINDAEGINGMRAVGRLTGQLLDYLTPFVKPGITTNELDRLAEQYTTEVLHATSAPLDYQPAGYVPYPKSICTSINHQVCHGIPNDKPLKKGDIVNIDITVIKDGWHGDSSRMFVVGDTSIAARRLCALTYEAHVARHHAGAPRRVRLGDIGWAIQKFAEGHGFSVVREFCGHGIGRKFHEEPQVLHYGKPGTLEELEARHDLHDRTDAQRRARDIKDGLGDGWTIVTKDHSLSAQWEHTILVTPEGYEVLTLSEGGPPVPAISSRPEPLFSASATHFF